MASACVNNIAMSPEKNFLDCSPAKYGWLIPRISFSREFQDEEASKVGGVKPLQKVQVASENAAVVTPEESDPNVCGMDFEFRLENPVTMLPADELFSDGKLVPLQLYTIRHSMMSVPPSEVKSPDTPKLRRRDEIAVTDPYLFSPKAPRCSSRWKELLGLKKIYQNSSAKQDESKTTSSLSCNNKKNAARGLKHLLQRSSKSSLNASIDSSLSLPLLKDSDNESVSISSRLSLSSSSSSGREHDDLPRLSLDSDKPSMSRNANYNSRNRSRVRVVNAPATRVGRSTMRRAPEVSECTVRGVSVDSPRMNSSGKIVFQSLERSSSSPSSFNGGPRYKYRGMERSYSANVRVTPVLNVPICSLRGSSKSGVFGFPLFSSQQRREGGCNSCSYYGGGNKVQSHSRNRTDRT